MVSKKTISSKLGQVEDLLKKDETLSASVKVFVSCIDLDYKNAG